VTLQDGIVALIAAGALAWLVTRFVRSRRRGAPACENCPAAGERPAGVRPPPEPTLLMDIGEPPAKRGNPR
jgi:hypothetical protein